MHIALLRKRITSLFLDLTASLKEPLSLHTLMLHGFRVYASQMVPMCSFHHHLSFYINVNAVVFILFFSYQTHLYTKTQTNKQTLSVFCYKPWRWRKDSCMSTNQNMVADGSILRLNMNTATTLKPECIKEKNSKLRHLWTVTPISPPKLNRCPQSVVWV